MKIIVSSLAGFCPGVKNAVEKAKQAAISGQKGNVYCLGQLSHNQRIIDELDKLGVRTVDSIDQIPDGADVIIRSHGEAKSVFERLKEKNCNIICTTCPSVKKIHKIVKEHCDLGYKIIIIGDKTHPEVKGICGWCKDATVIDETSELEFLKNFEKVCVVSQTTFSVEKYRQITENIHKLKLKTVEFFDTICYTTTARQKEAMTLAKKCDLVLVIGGKNSSNTRKLYEVASKFCKAILVSTLEAIKNIRLKPDSTVGVIAGASTPQESIMEVIDFMSQNVEEVVISEELKAGIEESLISYKEGKRVKGTVISADEKGISVNIGGKLDGFIYAAESGINQDYNPEDFPEGMELEAMIIGKKDSETNCIPLSKRKVDLIKEGDKVIESIRGGEVFELLASSATKGGLLGRLGSYTVFIPSSQIREKGYPRDLNAYVKKKLRLTVLDIDDNRRKIVASQKKVLERERAEREEIFWTHVKPNVIVNGTVKRITNFGAFVSVDGFDCLAHIADLSWNHIKSVEEVLQKDKSYDFIVLSADREKGRVSLGYKQLQPHPFTLALQRHPVGSICKGKVVSIVPFGAFVQIEPGIEGLVHVSEAAHSFVKNINEVVKVGDEVDVMILAADEAARRITLSIKACQPEEAPADTFESKARQRTSEKSSWSEEQTNNPFADLLKDMDLGGNE